MSNPFNIPSRKTILTGFVLVICCSIFYWFLVRLQVIPPLTALPGVLCINGCTNGLKIHTPLPTQEYLNYDRSLKLLLKGESNKQNISLLIEKNKHRLTVFYNLKPIKSYPVVFGANPMGDKLQSGDRKTPEGILRVSDRYPHPAWSKFMWLDYPNSESWRKHFQAKTGGKLAWNASIGGEIGIHGVPQGADDMIDKRENWTLGCPSLKNKDVDELYEWVEVGTIVEIIP